MEQIPELYLIITLSSFLLLLAILLYWQYKKSRKNQENEENIREKGFRHFLTVNPDTVINGLAVAGCILFVRKLIYYVPFSGIIQTKLSIWWVEENVLPVISFFSLILLLLLIFIGILKGYIQHPVKRVKPVIFLLSVGLIYPGINVILPLLEGSRLQYAFGFFYHEGLNLIFFSPLLLLKMLCSGKYLGLFTSFAVGYFIIDRYKKVKPKITLDNAQFLIAPGVLFIVFFVFLYFTNYTDTWNVKLSNKVKSVSSETDMTDLLDAIHTINPKESQFESLEQIVSSMTKADDFRWNKKIYQRVIDMVNTLPGSLDTELLKRIGLWIADTGDISWAISVVEKIPDKMIRDGCLKKIREKIVR